MQRIHARIVDKGPFTEKESQVLRYMCEGLYTTEIAVRLFRSPRTIGKHIENIAHKLDARGSSEIVLIAREMGLVEITLLNSQHHVLKVILLLIMVSNLMPQYGMRNDMRRAPKTHRTPAVRLVRLQHRQ
jgi:DNA-binding CsgD family transcriptional regulator